jgi:hypothetical protein
MKQAREQLRFRVPNSVVEDVEKWADEKFPNTHGARQLLLTEILAEALRRRRDAVRSKAARQRRKSS